KILLLTGGWALARARLQPRPARHIIGLSLMYRLAVVLLGVSCAFAQSPSSPQDLLKEALAFQQAGKLDEAIRDYRTLLASYPNIPELRSNLGAALAGEGRY